MRRAEESWRGISHVAQVRGIVSVGKCQHKAFGVILQPKVGSRDGGEPGVGYLCGCGTLRGRQTQSQCPLGAFDEGFEVGLREVKLFERDGSDVRR